MSRTLNRLKPLAVEKAKTPGRYADGGGLYLIVKPGPRKSWAFMYRRDTKTTELGLGGLADVSLVQAREKAAEVKVKQAADAARKATAEFAIFTTLSMLIGAFIASAAAAYGGSVRDEH